MSKTPSYTVTHLGLEKAACLRYRLAAAAAVASSFISFRRLEWIQAYVRQRESGASATRSDATQRVGVVRRAPDFKNGRESTAMSVPTSANDMLSTRPQRVMTDNSIRSNLFPTDYSLAKPDCENWIWLECDDVIRWRALNGVFKCWKERCRSSGIRQLVAGRMGEWAKAVDIRTQNPWLNLQASTNAKRYRYREECAFGPTGE